MFDFELHKEQIHLEKIAYPANPIRKNKHLGIALWTDSIGAPST